jgi:hypothetical protein
MVIRQSVKWNRSKWDLEYPWTDGGDGWSAPWGGPEKQWHGAILPRIRRFLPARVGLEIAPGYGRWTRFLKDACERLILVDVSGRCIDACRQRFADCSHLSYHVNDGKSLAMVPDDSVDFVFSFDSLVHVEEDVLAAYLQQLARKLTGDGVGFIHHSNLGQYRARLWYRRIPLVRSLLRQVGLVETYTGFRSLSVSAASFAETARAAGLPCISQELVNWYSERLSDCLSIVTRPDSRWSAPNQVRRNPDFMAEARRIREAG